jgi:hypothetical protein
MVKEAESGLRWCTLYNVHACMVRQEEDGLRERRRIEMVHTDS